MSKKKTSHLIVAKSMKGGTKGSYIGVNLDTGRYVWSDTCKELMDILEGRDTFKGMKLAESLYVLDWANAVDPKMFTKVIVG